jgi:ribosomal-protein-alanine N-acetyltransferase
VLFPDGPLVDGDVMLRLWEVGDAGWYVEAARDPAIRQWTSEPADLTAGQVRSAIEAMLQSRAHLGMAVTDASTGRLLGNAGLMPAVDDPTVGQLSYWLAADARGRGAATRAVRLLTGWAWVCGLRRVELFTHIDNTASQRVAERAGLTRDRVVPRYRVINGQPWDVVFYILDTTRPER